MEPITIKLEYPVTVAEQTTDKLVFRRRMIARDLRGMPVDLSGLTIDQMMLVGGRMCGQVDAVMSELDFQDVLQVVSTVSDFFADGLTTGN